VPSPGRRAAKIGAVLVREAIAEVGLAGEPRGSMFVHTVPERASD
jgi:hypothetical protein